VTYVRFSSNDSIVLKRQNTAAVQNVAVVAHGHYVLCIVECGGSCAAFSLERRAHGIFAWPWSGWPAIAQFTIDLASY